MADPARKLKVGNEIGRASEIYKTLDANKDGSVTKQEISLALTKRKAELEKCGKEEGMLCQIYSDALRHFITTDQNKDDKITFAEYMVFFDAIKDKYY